MKDGQVGQSPATRSSDGFRQDRRSGAEPPRQDVEGTPDQPSVWLILSSKTGDNGQALRVAGALGWSFEHKYVHMRDAFVYGKPRVKPSLDHVDLSRSDPLEGPWPDLVITVGRRPCSVALWVREQSRGRTKIVLIGKPSGPIEWFDLVIASAESSFPPLPNVTPISLPLMSIDTKAIARAGEEWRPRLADLPRPLIALLVGGATGPFTYDRTVVDRLVKAAEDVIARTGGTVYVTTSRRTPESAVAGLRERLPPGAELFSWEPGATGNPYQALLALADGFIVTGDSISMMVEVVLARKPLAIFPVPVSLLGAVDQWRRVFLRKLFTAGGNQSVDGLRQAVARVLYRLGLAAPTRDFLAFHKLLIDSGWAVPMGQGFPEPRRDVPDDLPRIVAAIKALCHRG